MSHDYRALSIAAVRRETPDAISLALAVPPDLRESFAFKPGQHVPVRAVLDGEEVRRTYSISSSPGDDKLWITIKHVPDGRFSGWAHSALKPGATLDCMPPAGRFVLHGDSAAPRRILAIAAGSGITPVIAIAEHVLSTEPDSTVTLIYGNRTVDSIIFRERLESLKNRHLDRLQILHVLSRDAEADVPLLAGRIDAERIRAMLGSEPFAATDEIFLCGPDTLIKTARDTLIDMGAPRDRIRFEFFRAGPEEPARKPRASSSAAAPSAQGTEVSATLDGVRRTFRVPEGARVIDAALDAGIKLPYSCKGGMCCTCRAFVVEGAAEMERNFSLEQWEIDKGFVLTCQARPTTPRLVLDYDRV